MQDWRCRAVLLVAWLCLWFLGAPLGVAADTPQPAAAATPPAKPVIVLAAFGTSVADGRKAYEHMDARFREHYPGYDIRWGFTAQFIVNKLRQQGDATILGLPELVARLKQEGVKTFVVQSLHVFPGEEAEALVREAYSNDMRVTFGAPLITSDTDVAAVTRIVVAEVKPGIPNVGIGHGNSSDADFNRMIGVFAKNLQDASPDLVLATVEGQPGTAPLLKVRDRVKLDPEGRVHFIPVMIVAGDHVHRDVLADEDSWKTFVGAKAATCAPPLGMNDRILELYFQHLDTALAALAAGQGSVAERQAHLAALEAKADVKLGPEKSRYAKWKRALPFWPQKGWMLLELMAMLAAGVLLGQVLEVSGVIRYLAVLTWPLLKLGRLPTCAGPAFLMSFQSGAVSNSMLITAHDQGHMTRRELYTSVLVVSGLSLFAHLPTFVMPLGAVLGWQATLAFFSVRIAAIMLQVLLVLLLGGWLLRGWLDRKLASPAAGAGTAAAATPPAGHVCDQCPSGEHCTKRETPPHDGAKPRKHGKPSGFWRKVWNNSARTLKRLIVFVVPTFVLMAVLERVGFFIWLGDRVPGLFKLSWIPPETMLILPAQAVNLYNGAVAAGNFVAAGAITPKQAVIVLLIGSVMTAPVRTLRHALPTYIATLGLRPGTTLAIGAQALRCCLVVICTFLLNWLW